MTIVVKGEKTLPIWDISHYLDQTSSHYHKLVTICKMCELTAEGVEQSDFVVSAKSIDVFQEKGISYGVFKKHLALDTQLKGEDAENFWLILRKYKRPIVYYKSDNGYLPVFDPNGEEQFKVTKMEVNSPPLFDVSGIGSALSELFTAGRQAQREQVRLQQETAEHENRLLEQRARNLNELSKASEILNREGVHPGMRHYAEQEIIQIMESQRRLNSRAAISGGQVDRSV
jgi:hypothetical protein